MTAIITPAREGVHNYAPNAGFMEEYWVMVVSRARGTTEYSSAHSGESRNLEPQERRSPPWIPAFAGMSGGVYCLSFRIIPQ